MPVRPLPPPPPPLAALVISKSPHSLPLPSGAAGRGFRARQLGRGGSAVAQLHCLFSTEEII